MDGVVAEVLKYGSAWMLELVWRVCVEVFRGGEGTSRAAASD